MKYLLMMFDAPDYWSTGSDERDAAEEQAFGEFCGWMRAEGITWQSAALTAPEDGTRVSYVGAVADAREVVSGFFLLDVPETVDPHEIVTRCPHISTSSVELRRIESGDV